MAVRKTFERPTELITLLIFTPLRESNISFYGKKDTSKREVIYMKTEEIYKVVKNGSLGFDAIYENYILELVGVEGLEILRKNRLIETCGVINGRQLYVLIQKDF